MAIQQSDEISEAFVRFYTGLTQGDVATAIDLLSHDDAILGIGTDPAEWLTGHATLERVLTAQMQEMKDAGFTVQPGHPQSYVDGNVGWCADRAQVQVPNGPAMPFRMTAVFHREGGAWKIVQFHTSFGVSTTDTLGTEMTTE